MLFRWMEHHDWSFHLAMTSVNFDQPEVSNHDRERRSSRPNGQTRPNPLIVMPHYVIVMKKTIEAHDRNMCPCDRDKGPDCTRYQQKCLRINWKRSSNGPSGFILVPVRKTNYSTKLISIFQAQCNWQIYKKKIIYNELAPRNHSKIIFLVFVKKIKIQYKGLGPKKKCY